MANCSVSEISDLINNRIASQEKIEVCLWKLEALISVAVLTDNFYELPDTILHSYFSIASDLIEDAKQASQVIP